MRLFVFTVIFIFSINSHADSINCFVDEGDKICLSKVRDGEIRSFYLGNSDQLIRQTITYNDGALTHRFYEKGKLKEEKSYIGNVDYYFKNFSIDKERPKNVPMEAKYVKILKKWVLMSISKGKLHGKYEYYSEKGSQLLKATFDQGRLTDAILEYDTSGNQIFNININASREITVSVNKTGFPAGVYVGMMEKSCR